MFHNSTTLIFQELKYIKDLNKTKLECKNGILDVICKVTTIIQYCFLETVGYGSSTEKSISFKPQKTENYLVTKFTAFDFALQGLKSRFRCKKSGYFTKPVKTFTNGVFICHKQVNNGTKSNSQSLKKQ